MNFSVLRRIKSIDSAIISDIVLWLALAMLGIGVIYYIFAVLPLQRGQQITLQFHDASAIIEGSSVDMMGLEVGHVSHIDLKEGHVDVSIITEPGMPKIPEGTEFTILFTGLGGSESIEATLPNMPTPSAPMSGTQGHLPGASSGSYMVSEPVRLKQVLDMNITIAKSLEMGSQNITDFFGKKRSSVEALQENTHIVKRWSQQSAKVATDVAQRANTFYQQLDDNTYTGLKTLETINHQVKNVEVSTEPHRLHVRIQKILPHLTKQEPSCWSDICSLRPKKVYLDWNPTHSKKLIAINSKSDQADLSLKSWEAYQLDKLGGITIVNIWLDNHPLQPRIKTAHQQIRFINTQFPAWNAKVDALKAKLQK